ncbi:MAG: hypothetical protein RRY64_10465, partial [Oscillospiraceae bacterium]
MNARKKTVSVEAVFFCVKTDTLFYTDFTNPCRTALHGETILKNVLEIEKTNGELNMKKLASLTLAAVLS